VAVIDPAHFQETALRLTCLAFGPALRRAAATAVACLPLLANAAPTLLGDLLTVSSNTGKGTVVSAAGVAGADSLRITDGYGVGSVGFDPAFTATTISLGHFDPLGQWYFVDGTFFEVSGIDALVTGATLTVFDHSFSDPTQLAVSFTDHSVRIDLSRTGLLSGGRVELALTLADPVIATVPEPSALALVLLALGGVGLAASRRRG